MPSRIQETPTETMTVSPEKKEKSSKKSSKHDKSEHKSSKKRHREADGSEPTERKHKKSKSSAAQPEINNGGDVDMTMADDAPAPAVQEPETSITEPKKEKKKRKKQKEGQETNETDEAATVENGDASKKDKKKKKKSKHDQATESTSQDNAASVANAELVDDETTSAKKEKKKSKKDKKKETATAPDAMDVDSPAAPRSKTTTTKTTTDKQAFPFFTQTVSQYLPLFPNGMVEPVDGFTTQHLDPLVNRYVPALRGVLLSYKNPRLGEAPGRRSLAAEPLDKNAMTDDDDEEEPYALLESIAESAVAYGWLTFDASLFCPSRGAWMEGEVNLQSEGHLGVICFGMFNASIEASRLPKGWRWVDLLSSGGGTPQKKNPQHQKFTDDDDDDNEKESEEVEDENGEQEAGAGAETGYEGDASDGAALHQQLHATGYWVDGAGARISGKLRFRIKNFEVGASSSSASAAASGAPDNSYLSIEGTMLDVAAEREVAAEEREKERRRRLRRSGGESGFGGLNPKKAPAFSMTMFGAEEGEDKDEADVLLKKKKTAAAAEEVQEEQPTEKEGAGEEMGEDDVVTSDSE